MTLRCTIVLVLLIAPGVLAADAPESNERQIQPREARGSRHASRVVLGVQAEERREAREAGLDGIAQELADLKRAATNLEFVEAASRLQSFPAGSPRSASAKRFADLRRDRQQQFRGRVQRIAQRRALLQDKLGEIRSPRQRRMARRLIRKLDELEREADTALSAVPEKRLAAVSDLVRRLELTRHGFATRDANRAPTPTFQIAPDAGLPVINDNAQ